ncbi:MAG TPA: J domain-containing protein [Prosthecobacter sp.]
MKDRQIQSTGAQPSIPILSPILHWLAMPVIVFLRGGFGFSFLSPKTVFLASIWAQVLFSIYAWMEQGAWFKYGIVAGFGLGASALYLLHLILAFSREVGRQGKHDFYSGTSHLLRLPGFSQLRGNPRSELMVHLWVEPFLALTAAAMLRAFFSDHRLSKWLVLVAAAMWLKEFINYWYGIRSEKKHEDIIEDAEEKMPGSGSAEVPLPAAGTRKPRAKRPPQRSEDEQTVKEAEFRYAEVLRLMPPYTLEQAEQNYRHLIKSVHPDPNSAEAGTTEKAATLNEAIEFFRSRSAAD